MRTKHLALGVAGLVCLPWSTACSSAAPVEESPSAPTLSGQYTPTSGGSIAEISFYDGSYVLWTTPCADSSGGATCMEEGRFVVNSAQTELTLTNGATGKSTTLPLRILDGGTVTEEERASSGLTTEDLRVQGDSLSGDGGGLTGGGSSLYTGDGGALTAQLATPVVTSGNVNGQNLSRTGPKPKCVFDDAFTGTASDLIARLQTAIQNHPPSTFSGDATQGHVEVFGYGQSVGASYRISGQTIHIEVTHKPWILGCGTIGGRLAGVLGATNSTSAGTGG